MKKVTGTSSEFSSVSGKGAVYYDFPLTGEDAQRGGVGDSPQAPGLVEPELELATRGFVLPHAKHCAPYSHTGQEQRGPVQRGRGMLLLLRVGAHSPGWAASCGLWQRTPSGSPAFPPEPRRPRRTAPLSGPGAEGELSAGGSNEPLVQTPERRSSWPLGVGVTNGNIWVRAESAQLFCRHHSRSPPDAQAEQSRLPSGPFYSRRVFWVILVALTG